MGYRKITLQRGHNDVLSTSLDTLAPYRKLLSEMSLDAGHMSPAEVSRTTSTEDLQDSVEARPLRDL